MTNYKNIAVIGAVQSEVDYLMEKLENKKILKQSNFVYYNGTIRGKNVTVVKCGVGKVSAAICTQILIDKFCPELIINIGCAGGIKKEINVGDIVIADKLIEHDMNVIGLGRELGYIQELDTVIMKSNIDDCNFIVDRLKSISKNVYIGLIVSGDRFVYLKEDKDQLSKNFEGVMLCDMESASIAHCCIQNNVKFLVIRTASDTYAGDSTVDYFTFSAKVGKQMAKNLYEVL